MFATTAFLEVESTYRREQLRRAWGGPMVLRLRRSRWDAAARRRHRPAHLARSGAVAGAR
ncbi:MAG: hypothetical protein LOY01_14770 [Brachybacterium paraconglomeratum]|nr:hypothetical protein [Brachybacterium paraconglomeratum]